jgi:uncharacterized protein (TIGR00730 family)
LRENVVHRFGEVCDHGIDRSVSQAVSLFDPVSGEHENSAASACGRQRHISDMISDHPGACEVGAEVALRLLEGGGIGFATDTCLTRGVRAHPGLLDRDARFVEVSHETGVEGLVVGQGEEAPSDTALVGDHGQAKACVAKSSECCQDAGDEVVVLGAVSIADVFDEGPIAIEKNERRSMHDLETMARAIPGCKSRFQSRRVAMPSIERVTVYAASSRRASPSLFELARSLGWGIAERGWTLVYGGADIGLMGALADAALGAGGRVEGVILDTFSRVAHAGLHELETVEDMRSRKAGLAHRGDAYVILPGGFGTLEELSEILVERQLERHRRPVVLVDFEGFWQPLLAQFDRMEATGVLHPEHHGVIDVVDGARAALDLLDAYVASPEP